MNDLGLNPHAWRCLELAWLACAGGNPGVGAVLIDAQGSVIAEGSNGISTPAAAGPLTNSRIAHAEMNVLAQIGPDQNATSATLYTSLEPCLMCAGAIAMHHLAEVRVMASDPLMHGLGSVTDHNDWARANWSPRDFSGNAEASRMASLFAFHETFLSSSPDDPSRVELMADDPALAGWIDEVVAARTLVDLAENSATLAEVTTALI